MNFPLAKLPVIGLLVALSVALGYFLAAIPNVELITASVFISGYLTGILPGVLIGCLSMGLYSTLNPYGMAPPPLFLAQILSYAIVGGSGGLMGRLIHQIRWSHGLLFGAWGLYLTIQYAILTTLAYVMTAGNHEVLFWGSIIQGLGFYVAHMVSNTFFFLFFVPLVLNRLQRLEWVSRFREPRYE